MKTTLQLKASPERLPAEASAQAGSRRQSPERSRRTLDILTTLLFYLSILFFFIGFNFNDTPLNGGWTQQFMPYPTGGQIRDICFVDSLLGFAVSDSSVLKTTNGGDNWIIKIQGYYIFQRIQFLNANTGFACGGNNKLLKTTNSGENWEILTPSTIYPFDMSVLNEDTIWLVDNNSLVGGVYRTTNGGGSWVQQAAFGNNNPSHIYMYNARIGFIDAGGLRRTTDGGASWTPIIGAGNFLDMYFVDSLTGWKCNLDMKKTTDGGLNWVTQTLPNGGNIILSQMVKFSNINTDTLWGVGSTAFYGAGQFRGMINRTVNGGNNWLFQIPDTTIHIVQYLYNKFVNSAIGWAYSNGPGVHTTTGGDTTFYTGIVQTPNAVPEKFVLKQNYPNPFNPRTVIPYSVSSSAYVKIIAYDITGREVQRMVDSYHYAGAYEVDFMGKFTSTGVYFYRMTVTDEKSNQVYTDTKKMILLK